MRQRILVILPRIPFPARDGAEVVMSQTLNALACGDWEVDVFTLNPSRQPKNIEPLKKVVRKVGSADVDTHVHASTLFWSLFRPIDASIAGNRVRASYWVSRFMDRDALRQLLYFVKQNGPYDAIQCETLFTAYYGLQVDGREVVLRSHNVEWMIQDNLSKEGAWWHPQTLVRKILAYQTRHYEKWVAERFRKIACISVSDAEWYQRNSPNAIVRHIAPGVSINIVSNALQNQSTIGFLGSLDWEPNRKGLEWFLHEVMPIIVAQQPTVAFAIAGRGSAAVHVPRSVLHVTHILGEVESAASFFQSQSVIVAPLFSGSGVRVKLLEAFANLCPVVTTAKGAEGLPLQSGVECVIENEPLAFAKACIELMQDHERARQMGLAAQKFVQDNYSWETSIKGLEELYSA